MKIQNVLLDIMQKEGVSQSDLAERMNISRQAMSQMLKGKDMRLSSVLSILEILGYSFTIEKEKKK